MTAFVHAHTSPAPVPFVPEICLYTAGALTPVWQDVASVPYWCVPWAGGQALARYVLDHPETIRGMRVVDFGAGGGVVAIAAKLAGAAHVVAVDVDPLACAACAANAELNGVALEILEQDIVGSGASDAEIVLAGDVWYEREPAARFDRWFRTLRARVITGDPGRSYVPADLALLATYEIPTTLDLESATSKPTCVLAYR